jgi:hypothetical protein
MGDSLSDAGTFATVATEGDRVNARTRALTMRKSGRINGEQSAANAELDASSDAPGASQRMLSFMHATRPFVVLDCIPHSYLLGVRP